MTTTARRPHNAWPLWTAAIATALAAAFAPYVVGAAALAATALVALVRSPAVRGVASETVVALYWIAFSLYSTIFFDVTIRFFFYPFYGAFLLAIFLALTRRSLVVRPGPLLLYAAFLLVAAASFVGFGGAVESAVVQRVLAYLVGGMVLLQVRSRRGLRPIFGAAVLSSLTMSTWVIVNAVRAGFRFRGDIEVNENVVAFMIGLGLVIGLGLLFGRVRDGRMGVGGALLLLALGVQVYAIALLASRGVTVAAVAAVLLAVAHGARRNPRVLLVIVGLFALGAGATFLPGGSNLMERFDPESGQEVESAGSRLPIWETTLNDYAEGTPLQLLLGRGFESSAELVRANFASLTSTHNGYLQILYEFGLVGLALLLALHAHALFVAWRMDDRHGAVMVALLSFLLGTNTTANATDYFLYWTALGVALAIGTWCRRPDFAPAPSGRTEGPA